MKRTGVVPEAFAASISLLSRSEMDAMPTPLVRAASRPLCRWTLPALFLRGLRDRADELAGSLVLLERDVSLRDHADESAVLDNGEPPNLVAGHQLECLVEVLVGLDTDEVARVNVSDLRRLR